MLFTTYISPVSTFFSENDISYHQYADDTQIFLSLNPKNPSPTINTLSSLVLSLESWFLHNSLQLNPTKTEFIKLGTTFQLKSITDLNSITIHDNISIPISTNIKTLGIYLDSKLTFNKHITSVIQSSNYHLRSIRHIRPLISLDLAASLSRCLILSKLDYCNSLLYNISQSELHRLQSIMNKAARITLDIPLTSTTHHNNDNLATLHWLPMQFRVPFKIAVITYKILSTAQPSYLNQLTSVKTLNRTLRSSSAIVLQNSTPSTNISSRAFRYSAPTIWNSIPPSIRNSPSLSTFKSNLRTFYYQLAYINS